MLDQIKKTKQNLMAVYRVKNQLSNLEFQYVVEVSFYLDSFREYIQVTEKAIKNEVLDKVEKHERFLKESQDHEIEQWHDYQDHIIKKKIAPLYYSSILISLYSFLEQKMLQLCKIGELKSEIKVKDLSGKGIFQFRKYLEKVLKIDFKELNGHWNEITKYNKLRNLLVHESVHLIGKNENKNAINGISKIEFLTIIDHGKSNEFVIEDSRLLINFINIINGFLNELYYEKV